MLPIAVGDYLRLGAVLSSLSLFKAMTRYPTLRTNVHLVMPTLVIAGDRDPLVRHRPRPRLRRAAQRPSGEGARGARPELQRPRTDRVPGRGPSRAAGRVDDRDRHGGHCRDPRHPAASQATSRPARVGQAAASAEGAGRTGSRPATAVGRQPVAPTAGIASSRSSQTSCSRRRLAPRDQFARPVDASPQEQGRQAVDDHREQQRRVQNRLIREGDRLEDPPERRHRPGDRSIHPLR